MVEFWSNKHESQLPSRELRERINKLQHGDDWAALYIAELERRQRRVHGRVLMVAAIATAFATTGSCLKTWLF